MTLSLLSILFAVVVLGRISPDQQCVAAGGAVTTTRCCPNATDFPNTCVFNPCVQNNCWNSWNDNSKAKVCKCPLDYQCFNGTHCVGAAVMPFCLPTVIYGPPPSWPIRRYEDTSVVYQIMSVVSDGPEGTPCLRIKKCGLPDVTDPASYEYIDSMCSF